MNQSARRTNGKSKVKLITARPGSPPKNYSFLFLSLPIPAVILTIKEGIFLQINDAFCRQTGYSRERSSARLLQAWVFIPGRTNGKEFIDAIHAEGKIYNVEINYRLKNGQVVPCLRSSTVLHLNGKTCILSALQNISAQKQAEKTLEETAIKFQALFENSRDAIGVSKTGIYEFVNPAYLELFGYTSFDELLGRPILDLIAPDSRPKLQN